MLQRLTKPGYTLQICKLVLCAALLLGPQVVLQLTAWSYMLVSYAQESSLETALNDTFSGQRPCELCQLIEAVEQEQETPTPGSRTTDDFRLLIPQLIQVAVSVPPHQKFAYPETVNPQQSLHWPVPAPPPRLMIKNQA